MSKSLACSNDSIKQYAATVFEGAIESVMSDSHELSARGIEQLVWQQVISLGRLLLGLAFAAACRRLVQDDLDALGLCAGDVSFRNDASYRFTATTSLGKVEFPSFAYRDRATGRTRNPGLNQLLPSHGKCRSTPMCLELEAWLAKSFAFRTSESAISFVTHGAVSVSDNTIARHAVQLGQMIDPTWLYQRPESIRTILEILATRDHATGRPLLYVSSDAHFLKRYTDETWTAEFKAFNGIRIWCEDARTGQLIHIGGEFSWGACEDIAAIFGRLHQDGILPRDGRFEDVHAQIVFVSDGACWLAQRIAPEFLDAVIVLDPYHALQWAAEFTAKLPASVGAKALKRIRLLLGFLGRDQKKKRKRRKGHKKTRRRRSHAHQHPDWNDLDVVPGAEVDDVIDYVERLLESMIAGLKSAKKIKKLTSICAKFIETFQQNRYRMAYGHFRRGGYQIGSGAMESLHRQASQLRLKLPGIKQSAKMALAIANLRLLDLVGRWDEFFAQPDFDEQLAIRLGGHLATPTQPCDLGC